MGSLELDPRSLRGILHFNVSFHLTALRGAISFTAAVYESLRILVL